MKHFYETVVSYAETLWNDKPARMFVIFVVFLSVFAYCNVTIAIRVKSGPDPLSERIKSVDNALVTLKAAESALKIYKSTLTTNDNPIP